MNYVDPEYDEGVLASIPERAWRQINSCGMVRELPPGYDGEMAAMEAAIRPPTTDFEITKRDLERLRKLCAVITPADPSAPSMIDWERMAAAHAHEADVRARALEMAQAKMARLTGELVVAKQIAVMLEEKVERQNGDIERLKAELLSAVLALAKTPGARVVPAAPSRGDVLARCMSADPVPGAYGGR